MYTYVNGKFTEVLSAKALARQVANSVQYDEDRANECAERARKTKEEVKAEIVNEYEEENKQLRERLRFSWGEFGSEKELEAYNEFVNEHMHNRTTSKANGGLQPYIIPHYTGIGCAKTVVCQICGQTKDITDTSVW